MELDTNKIDDVTLALLYLGLHDEFRAWKGFDWDALDRLHEAGHISDRAARQNRLCSPRQAWSAHASFSKVSLRSQLRVDSQEHRTPRGSRRNIAQRLSWAQPRPSCQLAE